MEVKIPELIEQIQEKTKRDLDDYRNYRSRINDEILEDISGLTVVESRDTLDMWMNIR